MVDGYSEVALLVDKAQVVRLARLLQRLNNSHKSKDTTYDDDEDDEESNRRVWHIPNDKFIENVASKFIAHSPSLTPAQCRPEEWETRDRIICLYPIPNCTMTTTTTATWAAAAGEEESSNICHAALFQWTHIQTHTQSLLGSIKRKSCLSILHNQRLCCVQ